MRPYYKVVFQDQAVVPNQSQSPTPSMIKTAYGLNTIPNNGSGQIIAIIDDYGDTPSNITSNLAVFCSNFGLPSANLTIVTLGSGISDPSWAGEIALDTQWAHAIAPEAEIMLILTVSSGLTDMFAGVTYAIQHGATIVSMSFGAGEFDGETDFDSTFAATNNLGQNVTYFASSGDNGGVLEYPCCSPYVVGVGATNLTMDSNGNRLSETGASLSGGGVSIYEPKPSYQTAYGVTGSFRQSPDVAFLGDSPGVPVFYSGSWTQLTGTSLACPCFAAMCAIANERRGLLNKSTLSVSSILNYLYRTRTNKTASNIITTGAGGITTGGIETATTSSFVGQYNTDFYDITSGTAGSFSCGPGYDNVTGLGTPNNFSYCNGIVGDLVGI